MDRSLTPISPNTSDYELVDEESSSHDSSPSGSEERPEILLTLDEQEDQEEHTTMLATRGQVAEAMSEAMRDGMINATEETPSGSEASRQSDSEIECLYQSVRNLSQSVQANAFKPTNKRTLGDRKRRMSNSSSSNMRKVKSSCSNQGDFASMSAQQLEEALRTSLSHLLTIAAAAKTRSSCCSSVVSESSCGAAAMTSVNCPAPPVSAPMYPAFQARLGNGMPSGPLGYYGGFTSRLVRHTHD